MLGVQNGSSGLDGSAKHQSQLGAASLELKRTVCNARDVEQSVQQSARVGALPLDHLLGSLLLLERASGFPAGGQRITDRSERIAQFVGKERQEFVFAGIGFAQGFLVLPQRLLHPATLDEIAGLQHVQVQATQFALARSMNRAEVSGEHTERLSVATDQGGRPYRTVVGRTGRGAK